MSSLDSAPFCGLTLSNGLRVDFLFNCSLECWQFGYQCCAAPFVLLIHPDVNASRLSIFVCDNQNCEFLDRTRHS